MNAKDDGSKFVPVVLTEKQLVSTFAAVRSVFMSSTLIAKTDEEKELVKPLAGAMLRLAEALDKARAA